MPTATADGPTVARFSDKVTPKRRRVETRSDAPPSASGSDRARRPVGLAAPSACSENERLRTRAYPFDIENRLVHLPGLHDSATAPHWSVALRSLRQSLMPKPYAKALWQSLTPKPYAKALCRSLMPRSVTLRSALIGSIFRLCLGDI